jgi:rubredoxin
MSEYVRRRDQGVCISCGCVKHWKEQDAGHLFHNALDFNEININCQCRACNFYKKKNVEYTLRAIDKYGKAEIDKLEYLKKSEKGINLSISDYERIIAELKEKLEEV